MPWYSAPGYRAAKGFHCTINRSATGKINFPLTLSLLTRANDSTYTMRVRANPKNFMANVTYANTTHVPGPLTKSTSGAPNRQTWTAVAKREVKVLQNDRRSDSPTLRARGNCAYRHWPEPRFSSKSLAFWRELVSPDDTNHVREHFSSGTGFNIRSISPVWPPEPRRIIMDPESRRGDFVGRDERRGRIQKRRSKTARIGRSVMDI